MPFYEYVCEECREAWTESRAMVDRDQPLECPRCRKPTARRVLSSFATSTGGSRGARDCGSGFG